MPDQAPNIDLQPGASGRLVYDKARRTIVTVPNGRTERMQIPETVSPEGLRERAKIMRGYMDESCARHLELAADRIEELEIWQRASLEVRDLDTARILELEDALALSNGEQK